MVELLVEHHAHPNQQVHLNNGESIWGLILISIYSTKDESNERLKKAWFGACLVLIKAGAKSEYRFVHPKFKDEDVSSVLLEVFGTGGAATLERAMEAYKAEQKAQSGCEVI